MLKIKRLWIPILFGVFFLVRCLPVVNQSFPERDIVFQLDTHYSGGGEDRIGFVNKDGSGETYLYSGKVAAVVRPMWTDDGNLLLFTHPSNYVEGITRRGFGVNLRDLWAPEFSFIHGKEEILVISSHDGSYAIKRVSLDTERILAIYKICEYQIDDPHDASEGISIGTNNFYKQQLLYERWWMDENDVIHEELVVLDTDANERRVLLEFSEDKDVITCLRLRHPAFSPDGQWIAYTSNDGIYLLRSDGSENHQIVKTKAEVNPLFWPPAVSWSPDGRWIVYHLCMLESKERCMNNVEDSNIFKYNIETGEEVMLVEGGVNPYWRWAEE